MKCKRPLLLFCALLFLAYGVGAQSLQPCVVVEQTDGTPWKCFLSHDPQIRYISDEVIVTSADAELTLQAAYVARIYLSEAESENVGVGELLADAPSVSITSSAIALKDMAPGTVVTVYSFEGRLLVRAQALPDGSLTLPMSSLPQGVLIVNAGKISFKVCAKN